MGWRNSVQQRWRQWWQRIRRTSVDHAESFLKMSDTCLWQHFCNACILHQLQPVLRDKMTTLTFLLQLKKCQFTCYFLDREVDTKTEFDEVTEYHARGNCRSKVVLFASIYCSVKHLFKILFIRKRITLSVKNWPHQVSWSFEGM